MDNLRSRLRSITRYRCDAASVAAAVDSFSSEVLGDVYEGLMAESADGAIVPGVAAYWTKDPSVRLAWLANYDDAGSFLDTFRSSSANDGSGYINPQFDALIAEAERTGDIHKRREILESAERTMLADYPVIPIDFFSSKRLFKPDIQGVQPQIYDLLLRVASSIARNEPKTVRSLRRASAVSVSVNMGQEDDLERAGLDPALVALTEKHTRPNKRA